MPLLNGAGAVYSVQVALVTLNLDDGILDLARDYAAQSGLSLDELVCALIRRVAAPKESASVQEMFSLADRNGWRSTERWSREDAYDAERGR